MKYNGIELKTGMRCRCKIRGVQIDDAKIIIEDEKSIFICQNVINGSRCDDLLGYKYSYCFTLDRIQVKTDFELLPRTLDDLVQGDVIFNKVGEKEILGIAGKAIITSLFGAFTVASDKIWTLEGLKDAGFQIKQDIPEPKKSIEERLYDIMVEEDDFVPNKYHLIAKILEEFKEELGES